MSIPVSTVPAVKAYLYAALLARTELAKPVLVTYDEPGPYQPDDIVAVLDTEVELTAVQVVGSGGAGWLQEQYQQQIVVDVFRGGDQAKVAFERAAALVAVVIDVVRLDPSCGGLVSVRARPTRTSYNATWDPEHLGRNVQAVVTVDVLSRI